MQPQSAPRPRAPARNKRPNRHAPTPTRSQNRIRIGGPHSSGKGRDLLSALDLVGVPGATDGGGDGWEDDRDQGTPHNADYGLPPGGLTRQSSPLSHRRALGTDGYEQLGHRMTRDGTLSPSSRQGVHTPRSSQLGHPTSGRSMTSSPSLPSGLTPSSTSSPTATRRIVFGRRRLGKPGFPTSNSSMRLLRENNEGLEAEVERLSEYAAEVAKAAEIKVRRMKRELEAAKDLVATLEADNASLKEGSGSGSGAGGLAMLTPRKTLGLKESLTYPTVTRSIQQTGTTRDGWPQQRMAFGPPIVSVNDRGSLERSTSLRADSTDTEQWESANSGYLSEDGGVTPVGETHRRTPSGGQSMPWPAGSAFDTTAAHQSQANDTDPSREGSEVDFHEAHEVLHESQPQLGFNAGFQDGQKIRESKILQGSDPCPRTTSMLEPVLDGMADEAMAVHSGIRGHVRRWVGSIWLEWQFLCILVVFVMESVRAGRKQVAALGRDKRQKQRASDR